MAVADQWSEFVETHGEVIGYDYGEVFVPIPPGNARAAQLHERMSVFGHPSGVPVYAPTSGEGS